ncbi:MAG: FtsW/RodA/SpoVE family cell cycle protein, partial [Bacteroidales bacterium]|nr:FtsW/RodA/SpoVE family cell cycle protein [Bacteroidales bacterium]
MIVIFLSIVSLIEVYSSIGKAAYDHGWDITTTVARHIGIVLGSYALMILICHMRLKLFSKLARIGYLCCLIMMGAMFVIAIYGKMTGTGGGHAATRWLDDIPVIGQFQPSEIAKYVLLIYLARLIAINQDTLKEKDTFKKLMIPVVLIAGLIFPENFSTAALVFLACIVLM